MRWLNFASGMALFFISFPANWLVCLFELWTCKFSIVMCQWPAVSVTKHRWFPPPIFRPISNTDPPFFFAKVFALCWSLSQITCNLTRRCRDIFFCSFSALFLFSTWFLYFEEFFFVFGDKFPLLRAGHSAGFILSFSCRLLFYFFFFFNWSGIWQFSYLFIRWEIA